jgi:hypothetical protein
MTASQTSIALLVAGLVIPLLGIAGYQVFYGEQDDPILVAIALAQIVALAAAVTHARHARLWIRSIGVAQLVAVFVWLVIYTRPSLPFGSPGMNLPFSGEWVLLGLITAVLNALAATRYERASSRA